ncbi:MAG TPA: SMC-Scp complex subunit ScpB [Candidatus Paceibacterota bacterium]
MLEPAAALEALLFASGEAMEKSRIAKLLEVSDADLALALGTLREALAGRGLALVETESTVELRTAPGAAELVKKLREAELARDLGKAGLEALAIILYRGSATRGEIDWVRGVNSSATVRSLLLRGLIEGREDPADRRRMRYHATTDALAHLGISRVEDLPHFAEFARELKEAERDAENLETT